MALLARTAWFLVGLLAAQPAFAEPAPEELAVARDLFEAAQDAQTESDWQRCEQQLAEAVGIIETPGLRFHLAYCKEKQGRWVEALVDYKRANELVLSGVAAPDVEEMLGPAVNRLETELPKLVLRMQEVPEGTTLFLDGQERSTRLFGKPIPVDPGGRRINVTAPGFFPFTQHINLLSRERRTLSIKLVPKPTEHPVAGTSPLALDSDRRSDSPREPRRGASAKPWVLLAEGVVSLGGLALGVVEGMELNSSRRNRDRLVAAITAQNGTCAGNSPMRHPACDGLDEANENVALLQTVSTIGYVTAGVGSVALISTWIFWDDRPPTTAAHGLPTIAEQAIQLDVMHVPGGALGALRGQF